MGIGVVLVGDGAAALAPTFAELGIPTATSADGLDADRIFVLGVGDHAHAALLCAADEGVAGVVGIDGTPPVSEAKRGGLRAPVLAVYAEEDEGAAYSFAKALSGHGVLNETVVYDGVERGFLRDHDEARADVWRLIRRFMGVPAPD